jgi:hypothetical protein
VRAGFGIVGGLSIVMEIHHVNSDAEAWVFTLGFKPDAPAVRCWLSRSQIRTYGSLGRNRAKKAALEEFSKAPYQGSERISHSMLCRGTIIA